MTPRYAPDAPDAPGADAPGADAPGADAPVMLLMIFVIQLTSGSLFLFAFVSLGRLVGGNWAVLKML